MALMALVASCCAVRSRAAPGLTRPLCEYYGMMAVILIVLYRAHWGADSGSCGSVFWVERRAHQQIKYESEDEDKA